MAAAAMGALVALATLAAGDAALLWQPSIGPAGATRNRRLQTVPKLVVDVNVDEVARTVRHANELEPGPDGREQPVTMAFANAEGVVTSCSVRRSGVLPEGVASRMPDLFAFSGACDDGSTLFLNGQLERADGLSATFLTPDNGFVYMDSAQRESNQYVVYRFRDGVAGHGAKNFSCGVTDNTDDDDDAQPGTGVPGEEPALPRPALRGAANTTKAYIFRLAMSTSREYSEFHGGTLESTMQSLLTLLTRVNGIYMRELGVYFELVPNSHELVCLPEDESDACLALGNSGSMRLANAAFIEARGVSSASFDIGHALSTSIGGSANKPSVCAEDKAAGTTGLNIPDGDPFFVDYVAHELGHQLDGSHAFRHCDGQQQNFMQAGAVEPGSGSSIMGYAGICRTTNLQSNSDPYFNSVNLLEMRAHVAKVTANPGCGRVVDTGRSVPKVSAPEFCVLPARSRFQLRGTGGDDAMWFSWERSDTGYKSFKADEARFRSWKPRQSRSRYFPSLYFTTFGLEEVQQDEKLTVLSEGMVFRFTGRQLFDASAESGQHALAAVGGFSTATTTVSFNADLDPLVVQAPGRLTPGEAHNFSWSPGRTALLSRKVLIMVAVNTMEFVSNFDYELHEKDLDWVLLGEAPTSAGWAVFEVPDLAGGAEAEVNVMVRSPDDACFFFDMAPRVSLVGLNTPAPSTSSPTSAPIGTGSSTASIAVIAASGVIILASGVYLARQFAPRRARRTEPGNAIEEPSEGVRTVVVNGDVPPS